MQIGSYLCVQQNMQFFDAPNEFEKMIEAVHETVDCILPCSLFYSHCETNFKRWLDDLKHMRLALSSK